MNQGDVTSSGRHTLDIWHVRLAGGETRSLSLDELDAAFEAGWVDERTPVLAAGAIHWAPLGQVAGLDAPPAPVSSMPNSIAPLALDNYAPDAAARDLRFDLDAPMDAESDAEVQAFRPRRSGKVLRIMTAMVVVAGLGFAAFRAKPAVQRALAARGGHATPVAAAAVVEAKPAAPAAAPAPEPAAPAAAQQPIATMPATSLPNVPLTAEEKKAAAAEARKAKRAAAAQKRK